MTLLALTTVLISAVHFDVASIPVGAEDTVFLAQPVERGPADVFVLRAHELAICSIVQKWPPLRVPLDDAVSAVDVADLDGDGRCEIVAVADKRILLYPIPAPDALDRPVSARELFRAATQVSSNGGRPYPFVLVVPWESRQAIALPCEDTLNVYSPSGDILASYPIGEDAPQRVTFGRPFSSWPVDPPQAGAPDSLELVISRVSEYEPNLPTTVLPLAPSRPFRRSAGYGPDFSAPDTPYSNWLWFPLDTGETSAGRVYFAPAPPDYRNTSFVVRRDVSRKWLADDTAKAAPALRYPGILIPPGDDLPDLNGDGMTDALFWNSPEPGTSVEALTRALLGGDWPVRVTAHLYNAGRGRYAPTPKLVMESRVPVGWFLEPGGEPPLRHIVVRDVDGDGNTDFACSSARNRFSIWLTGQGAKAAFEHEFDDAIEEVEFAHDLTGRGRTSIALRTASHLHVIRPAL